MPPRCKFTREEITAAALQFIRKEGLTAMTARSVAAELKASPKVIFGLFQGMQELQTQVILAAQAHYDAFTDQLLSENRYPPYKAVGMAYVLYASRERELFRLLYMRDRRQERQPLQNDERAISVLMEQYGISREQAGRLQLHMWFYIHGIAALIATDYLPLEEAMASQMLTEHFQSMIKQFQEEMQCQ